MTTLYQTLITGVCLLPLSSTQTYTHTVVAGYDVDIDLICAVTIGNGTWGIELSRDR